MESQNKTFTPSDTFCWECHEDGIIDGGNVLECRSCPRVFHQRCVQQKILPDWVCPECVSKWDAENENMDLLFAALNHAMRLIKEVEDAPSFFKPVDTEKFPDYREYIVCPMDISQVENKMTKQAYASTRAFLADFRWILHNCVIFNSVHTSELIETAKELMKVCKHEMAQIDACVECYVRSHNKREGWFLEPCRQPHLLLWAKLKGYPHWPAKAMKVNEEGHVDVRFFGDHSRAWIPIKDCYLYSLELPVKYQRTKFVHSIEEMNQHIKLLVERYGPLVYPSRRTAYNPLKEEEQLQQFIPGYKVKNNAKKATDDSSSIINVNSKIYVTYKDLRAMKALGAFELKQRRTARISTGGMWPKKNVDCWPTLKIKKCQHSKHRKFLLRKDICIHITRCNDVTGKRKLTDQAESQQSSPNKNKRC